MYIVKPYFSDKFICKADKCNDTCCAGWEIDIDGHTAEKYNSYCGDYNKQLKSGFYYSDDTYSFRLKECERCWFLADNGLCEIYTNLGKEYLCDICREHPRFYNFYDNAEEVGYGLCCEKTCELLFADRELFYLLTDGVMPDDDYSVLFDIRQQCFDIINACDRYFADNICSLLDYCAEIQSDYFNEDFFKNNISDKNTIFRNVLKLYFETEPINNDWNILLNQLSDNIDTIVSVSDTSLIDDVYYKKVVSYILYRHLIEASFDGNFIGGMCFGISALIFIHILDCFCIIRNGELNDIDRINNIKLWSKQSEYSRENTDMLIAESISLFFT